MLEKINNSLIYLRAIIPSIIFNFYYLPFRQAIKLPILCYKVRFVRLKGKVVINTSIIRPGMIRLGFNDVKTYPNNGMQWSNEGVVVFNGSASFGGGNSGIATLKSGTISFGNTFSSTAGGIIVASKRIAFGNNVQIGWGCKIIDTNFHPLLDLKTNAFKRGYGEVTFGDNVWFGMECVCQHSVNIPSNTVFAARSVITRGSKLETNCLHGGVPAKIIEQGVIRPKFPVYITDYSND